MNEVRENEINEAKGLNNDVEDIEADFDSELDSRYDDYLNGKNCMEVNYGGEPGEYEYGQDKYGKYAYGIYKEGATSERNPKVAAEVRERGATTGDHAGHLIPHSAGGRNDEINMDSQNANINQRDQRSVERNAAVLSRDTDNIVYYGVHNINDNNSLRPSNTQFTLGVYNTEAAKEDVEHYSFTNASHEDQARWSDIAIRNEPVDVRQDAGVSGEQRNLMNEMLGEEDAVSFKVGEGEMYHFIDTKDNEAVELEVPDNTTLLDETHLEESDSDETIIIENQDVDIEDNVNEEADENSEGDYDGMSSEDGLDQ